MSKSVLKWLLSIPAWPVWVVMVALVVVLAWQMLRGEALMCADGSVFAKKCSLTGIGHGAVVAFTRDCPSGWRPYEPGRGRFIVGVGSHDDEVEQLARGSTGDRHEHETMWVTNRDGNRDSHRLTVKLDSDDAERNNMPPYIALELCVFGADSG